MAQSRFRRAWVSGVGLAAVFGQPTADVQDAAAAPQPRPAGQPAAPAPLAVIANGDKHQSLDFAPLLAGPLTVSIASLDCGVPRPCGAGGRGAG
jgi:hypothetical protein